MKTSLLCVDFQKDFTDTNGFAFKPRASVDFIKGTVVPYLRTNGHTVAEIVSDYRGIPLSTRGFFCEPGAHGYESEIPEDVKSGNAWIKCQHSPVWVRENIGIAGENPGVPYADPQKFGDWLRKEVGTPEETEMVILLGLTVNCCVLCVAQELFFRGYRVKILKEATDDYGGGPQEKEAALKLIATNRWAEAISWEDCKKALVSAT